MSFGYFLYTLEHDTSINSEGKEHWQLIRSLSCCLINNVARWLNANKLTTRVKRKKTRKRHYEVCNSVKKVNYGPKYAVK